MSTTTIDDGLSCIEEWCDPSEKDDTGHGPFCPEYPMPPMTKADFVRAMESSARAAVEAYRMLLDEGYMATADRDDCVAAEAEEAAICYAGIGSCGRGWCDHGPGIG